jgi:hypothetical protein
VGTCMSKRRKAGLGCGISFDCVRGSNIGKPSTLVIASEPESGDRVRAILVIQISILLDASFPCKSPNIDKNGGFSFLLP